MFSPLESPTARTGSVRRRKACDQPRFATRRAVIVVTPDADAFQMAHGAVDVLSGKELQGDALRAEGGPMVLSQEIQNRAPCPVGAAARFAGIARPPVEAIRRLRFATRRAGSVAHDQRDRFRDARQNGGDPRRIDAALATDAWLAERSPGDDRQHLRGIVNGRTALDRPAPRGGRTGPELARPPADVAGPFDGVRQLAMEPRGLDK